MSTEGTEPPGGSLWAMLAIGAVAAVILGVSLQRSQIGFATEMDFTTTYGPEAQRILAGEPLLLEYHPPGYPFMVALARSFTHDWLTAGLWISGLAAVVVLLSSFFMFRRLAGSIAAWGALLACACSRPFLSFASMATSDMPFAALVCASLVFAIFGMLRQGGAVTWIAAGFIGALAYLTRSNGIVMAAIIAAPLLVPVDWGQRLRFTAAAAAAFMIPILAWAIFAHATHSPFSPTDNYLNLAVAAYGDDSGDVPFGEEAMDMEERFHDTAEVLAYDPVRLVRQLGYRLLKLPYLLAITIAAPPITLLAIPGLYLFVRQRRTVPFQFYLGLLLALMVVSGLVVYRARFFIFVIPFIGALAAVACTQIVAIFKLQRLWHPAAVAVAVLVAAFVVWLAEFRIAPKLETRAQTEFTEAIPKVEELTPPNALLYASSYTLSFETGRAGELIPDVDNVMQLHDEFCNEVEPDERPYLYIGSTERESEFRPELAHDLEKSSVPWLEKLAAGSRSRWSLYRIDLSDCSS